jgi:hypothetical protein
MRYCFEEQYNLHCLAILRFLVILFIYIFFMTINSSKTVQLRVPTPIK